MGLGGSCDGWLPLQVPEWSAERPVLIFDNRGVRESSDDGKRFSIADLAEDTATLLDATTGQLVNLVSNDVQRFDLVTIFLHFLWSGPLQVVVCLLLLIKEVGAPAAFAGMGVILVLIPVQRKLGEALRGECNCPWRVAAPVQGQRARERRRTGRVALLHAEARRGIARRSIAR